MYHVCLCLLWSLWKIFLFLWCVFCFTLCVCVCVCTEIYLSVLPQCSYVEVRECAGHCRQWEVDISLSCVFFCVHVQLRFYSQFLYGMDKNFMLHISRRSNELIILSKLKLRIIVNFLRIQIFKIFTVKNVFILSDWSAAEDKVLRWYIDPLKLINASF